MTEAIGTTATSYEILSKLAEGGMAELFLARARGAGGLERHVVLKRIARDYATDTQYVQMFLDEARLAAQLHHPNIAQVYDIGRLGASYFFTMEYVHGVNVHSLISRAAERGMPLPIGAVLAIVANTAAGLDHAHERTRPDGKSLGIIHRDVSPSNLIVSYSGHVKVVDFGVAKAAGREETRAGEIKGKVGYLSPEQCRIQRLDRRSDLYALGIVAWEMLTAKRLWRRETMFATMAAIATEKAPPPSIYRPDLPSEVDGLVGKLLATEVADRFQTAAEVYDAIEVVARSTGANTGPDELARLIRELFGDAPELWRAPETLDGVTVTAAPIPAKIDTRDTLDDPTIGDIEQRLTASFPTVTGEIEVEDDDDFSATKLITVPRVPSDETREVPALARAPVVDPEDESPTHRASSSGPPDAGQERTIMGSGEPRRPSRLPPPPSSPPPVRVPQSQPIPRGDGPVDDMATTIPGSGPRKPPAQVASTVIDAPLSGPRIASTVIDVPISGPQVLPDVRPRSSPPVPRHPPPPHGNLQPMLVWWIIGGSVLGIGLTILLLARSDSDTTARDAAVREVADAVAASTIDAGAPAIDAADEIDDAVTLDAGDPDATADDDDLAELTSGQPSPMPPKLRTKRELNAAFRARRYKEIVEACLQLGPEGERAVVCTLSACRAHDDRAQDWYRNIAPRQRDGAIGICKQADFPIEDVCAKDGICRQ